MIIINQDVKVVAKQGRTLGNLLSPSFESQYQTKLGFPKRVSLNVAELIAVCVHSQTEQMFYFLQILRKGLKLYVGCLIRKLKTKIAEHIAGTDKGR